MHKYINIKIEAESDMQKQIQRQMEGGNERRYLRRTLVIGSVSSASHGLKEAGGARAT